MKPRRLAVALAFVVGVTLAAPAAPARADQLTDSVIPRPTPCNMASAGPSLTACLALSGITPEVGALQRLACVLGQIERWKLSALSCAQRQVNEWQEAVMWPRSVLDSLRTASLARVTTLREQYEEMIEDWSMPAATQTLASVYGSPHRVTRADYEAAWGVSRGPTADITDLAAWMSAANRNTIQGRTSAAFGLAGELPENTWERIGREGARLLAESKRDPLSAMRHTPQMLADRARVETNTLRLQAQALATRQLTRDFKRYKERRAQALGGLWLKTLMGSAAPGASGGPEATRAGLETRS